MHEIFVFVFFTANRNDIKRMKNREWKNSCYDFKPNVTDSMYCNQESLLHGAAQVSLYYYSQLLVQNGFEHQIDKQNCEMFIVKSPLGAAYGNHRLEEYFNKMLEKNKKNDAKNDDENNNNNNSNNSNNNNNLVKKSEIEASYFKLKQKTSFAKWFLLYLGCDFNETKIKSNYNECIPDHSLLYASEYTKEEDAIKAGLYNDDLFYGLDKFSNSLQLRNLIGCQSHDQCLNLMDTFVRSVMSLLNDKMVLLDDVLVLCFEYCKQFNNKLRNEFISLLQNVCKQCLDSNFKSQEKTRFVWLFSLFCFFFCIFLL